MADLSQIKTPNGETYNLRMPLVEGSGSTAGTWLGTLDGLTAYYDGLLILYKPSVAGASTTTLNLNNLGAKTCYISNTTKLTTHFPVNQPILLVYSAEQNGGCWMCIDDYYWNATVNRVRQTLVSGDANRPLLMAYSANTVTTTNVDNVSYRNNNIYANPSTGKIHATGFVGDLEGDATSVNGHELQQDIPDVITFKFESAPQLIKSLTGNTVGKSYSYYDSGAGKYRFRITEFKFIVTVGNTAIHVIIDVPVEAITATEQTFRSGWFQINKNGGGAYMAVKYTAISGSTELKEFSYYLAYCYLNSSDVTSASKVDVYVRFYLDKYE